MHIDANPFASGAGLPLNGAMRILLVEDHIELSDMLVERLKADGHAVDLESDGAEAERLLRLSSFDVVILDVNLPGKDGYAVLRTMRQRGDKTPVLLLTARSQVDDRIAGLDTGADDYMIKPFDYRELVARCRALVRRQSGAASNQFQAGRFVFDRTAKRAFLDETDLDLRNRDVQLLEVFLGNLGRVLSKDDMAEKLYRFDEAPTINALEQSVTRLRRKLERSPVQIRTIRGLGYMAVVQDE